MKCSKVELNFSEFLEEELPVGLQSKMAEHIENCAACRKSYAEFKALMGRLEAWTLPPPREDYFWQMLPQRIAAQVPPPPKERRWSLLPGWTMRPQTALAAVFCLVLALGVWLSPVFSPRQPSVAVKTAALTTESQPQPSLFNFSWEDLYQLNPWLETVKTVDKLEAQETGQVGEAMTASLNIDDSINRVPADVLLNEGNHMISLYKEASELPQPDLHEVMAYLDSSEDYRP